MESEGDGDGAGDRQRWERKERRSYHDTSVHLCTPLCTSAHLCAPLHTLLHTSTYLRAPPRISAHLCTTFALHFPGLVTLIRPSILTFDPFSYPGQLTLSPTGHNAHPSTSFKSRPNPAPPTH